MFSPRMPLTHLLLEKEYELPNTRLYATCGVRRLVPHEGTAYLGSIRRRNLLSGCRPLMNMTSEINYLVKKLIPFLKAKNEDYKERGLVPTLDLLIEDLEKLV